MDQIIAEFEIMLIDYLHFAHASRPAQLPIIIIRYAFNKRLQNYLQRKVQMHNRVQTKRVNYTTIVVCNRFDSPIGRQAWTQSPPRAK